MGISDLLSDLLVLQQQHLGGLCRALVSQASEEEMESLCCRMGIDYDDLSSKGRAGRARELVRRLDYERRISELTRACHESDQDIPVVTLSDRDDEVLRASAPLAAPTTDPCDVSHTPDKEPNDCGEPAWVDVPAGEFWMGSGEVEDDNGPGHTVYLGPFQISPVPVTVAQYQLFVEASGYSDPFGWADAIPPYWKDCPAVYVSWHDALAYCDWLSDVTGKSVTLPSEAQWEKAARGHLDRRTYPWGEDWDRTKSNTREFGRDDAMPVGTLRRGASPYGCLDMAGQVWEWTASLWGQEWSEPDYRYPYDPTDGRENVKANCDVLRVIRGGSFVGDKHQACCAHRAAVVPSFRDFSVGFRVVNQSIG